MTFSSQSILVSRHPIGEYSGREVRDILCNDKNVPAEIVAQLDRCNIGVTTVSIFKHRIKDGCIEYQGIKYQVCWGTTLSNINRNFEYVTINFRYWGILPFGYAYVTGLHEAWIHQYELINWN